MFYDATRFLENGMEIYPGDPPFRATDHYTMQTNGVRVTKLELGNHSGTHLDAPSHFIPDGISLDDVGLAPLIGPCRVVHIQGIADMVSLARLAIVENERLLLAITEPLSVESAEFLARRKLCLLGVNLLSVGGKEQHQALLNAGVVILEGLLLQGIPEGAYNMVALPLKIRNANGAPARVILWDNK